MKRWLKVLVGLLVLVALAYWLLVDRAIQWVIEREATREVKARVELERVRFHLYPTSLTLHGLQVTNPSSPMHNLVEAGRIHLDLELAPLLQRQVVAEEMHLNELAFNRPRNSSGAIPGLTPPPPEPADYGLAGRLPSTDLADVRALVDAEKQRLQGEIRAIRDEFKAIERDWRQRVETLPDSTRIEEYRRRARELERGGNVLQRLGDLDALRKDVRADLKALSGLEDQLKQDLATVDSQQRRARDLPAEEARRLLARAGLDGAGMDDLVKVLLGPRIAELLTQGLGWYQQLQAEPEVAPTESDWLVLVRRTLIDGRLELGGIGLGFEGVAHNLTPQQAEWELPIDFSLNGRGQEGSEFAATGRVDHIDPERARDRLEFALSALPLQALRLSDQPSLSLTLKRGLADLSGSLELDGEALQMSLQSQFQQVVLEALAEQDNALAQALADTLEQVSRFGLDLTLSGTLDQPSLHLQSDLNRLLAQAAGNQLRSQIDALQGQLTEQLQGAIGDDLEELQGLAGQLRGLEQLLGERGEALQGLLRL